MSSAFEVAKAYCERTQLHGPGFIAASRTRVDAAFWILLTLASLGMFVRDVYNLTLQYESQETTIALSVSTNASFSFPQPSVCLEFPRFLLSTGAELFAFTYSLTGPSLDLLLKCSCTPNCSVDYFLSGTVVNYFNASQPMYSSSFPTIYSYLLLALYEDYDIGAYQAGNEYSPNSGNELFTPYLLNILGAIERCMAANNISAATLKRALASIMCTAANVKIIYKSRGIVQSEQVTCSANIPFWFGPTPNNNDRDLFCFGITNATLFQDINDIISVSNSYDSFVYSIFGFWQDTGYKVIPPTTNGQKSGLMTNAYFDPNGGAGFLDLSQAGNMLRLPSIQTSARATVGLSTVIKAYNRSTSPCSATERFNCTKTCILETIVARRACWPLSFYAVPNPTGVPPCTTPARNLSGAYADVAPGWWAKVNASTPLWTSCWEACLPTCETTLYKFTVAQYKVNPLKVQNIRFNYSGFVINGVYMDYDPDTVNLTEEVPDAQFSIEPSPIVYTIMEEQLALDVHHLLLALGGSMGLWIGASLVAFVHSLVFLHFYLCRCRGEKQMPEVEQGTLAAFRYFGISPIHGLVYIRDERHSLPKLIFWLLVVGAAIGLFINDTMSLVKNYKSQPMTAHPQIVQSAFPDLSELTLCLLISRPAVISNEFTSLYDKNFGNMSAMTSAYFTNTVVGALSAGDWSSIGQLPYPIAWRAYVYLTSIIDYDRGALTFIGTMQNSSYITAVDADITSMTDVFNNTGVNMFTLTKFIGSTFCQLAGVQVTLNAYDALTGRFNQTPAYDVCNPDSIVWIGSKGSAIYYDGQGDHVDRVCVKLSSAPSLNDVRDYLSVTTGRAVFQNATNSSGAASSEWLTGMHFDVQTGAGSVDNRYYDVRSLSTSATVSTLATFSFDNTSSNPCSNTDRFTCTKSCQYNIIKQQRNCTTITYFADYDGQVGRACTTWRSLKSQAILASTTILQQQRHEKTGPPTTWDECASQCIVPCDVRTYQVSSVGFVSTSSSSGGLSGALFRSSVGYMDFEVTADYDIWAFFADFGSSMGLWIGGSIIALTQVPLFWLAYFIARIMRCWPMAEKGSYMRHKITK